MCKYADGVVDGKRVVLLLVPWDGFFTPQEQRNTFETC
jgi:hypothetical protein